MGEGAQSVKIDANNLEAFKHEIEANDSVSHSEKAIEESKIKQPSTFVGK